MDETRIRPMKQLPIWPQFTEMRRRSLEAFVQYKHLEIPDFARSLCRVLSLEEGFGLAKTNPHSERDDDFKRNASDDGWRPAKSGSRPLWLSKANRLTPVEMQFGSEW